MLSGRGDSNCSGDIALEPGKVDSIFFPGRVAGCRRLIAISCSASLMTSGSSGCRDSNIASGRSYRRKELLSVLRMVPEVFPCGRRGSGIHHHAAFPMRPPPAPPQAAAPAATAKGKPRYGRLLLSEGQLWGLYGYRASGSAPMPPAPLGLLPFGGAGRIRFLGLSDCSYRPASGQVENGTDGDTSRCSSKVGFAAWASCRSGRIVLPLSQYRRARRPPISSRLCFSGVPFFSARMQKKERGA